MRYLCSCVNWPQEDVDRGLIPLIEEAITVSRRAFLRHVDRGDLRDIERDLGYDAHPRQGLTMAGDWHVRYFRSRLHGRTVYGFQHSAIEHVFAPAGGDMLTAQQVAIRKRRAA